MRLHLLLVSAVLVAGCSRHGATAPDPMVHTLALPEVAPPELPDAPGRAMFYGACSTCHTPRYVFDQPPMSRQKWAAEVDKMKHAYGAPFPEQASSAIVDYLVAVRGTGA